MADTSYGSCCVDEVAAEHIRSELVIHFGHTCLSNTSRLPVIYAFGETEFNVNDCFSYFSTLLSHEGGGDGAKKILILSDVKYLYFQGRHFTLFCLDAIHGLLSSNMCADTSFHYGEVEKVFNPTSLLNENSPRSTLLNRRIIPEVDLFCEHFPFSKIFFIGDEDSSFLITLMMTIKGKAGIYSYSPKLNRGREEGFRVNVSLSKRFHLSSNS